MQGEGQSKHTISGAGSQPGAEETAMRGRYRSQFTVQGMPLVSILIPNKDHVEDLRRCLASIREKSTYANYEILVIENNSVEAETEAYYQRLLRGASGWQASDFAVSGQL